MKQRKKVDDSCEILGKNGFNCTKNFTKPIVMKLMRMTFGATVSFL